MQLLIISGLSGSGKSIVLDTLEDAGYYCIDNLPVPLLDNFIDQIMLDDPSTYRKTAIGIDARNQSESLREFGQSLNFIRSKGVLCKVFFMYAEEHVLIRRYSETRRRHPLTDDIHSLKEAIAIEKEMLKPISVFADFNLDTSHSHYHQLRQRIKSLIEEEHQDHLSIQLQSFGFKHGIPRDVDFMFDARSLPNPYWNKDLRQSTGKDQPVIDFLEQEPLVDEFLNDVAVFLKKWVPRFAEENRCYLTIAIGCTGGQHRSVYLVDKLAKQFKKIHKKIIVQHRELL